MSRWGGRWDEEWGERWGAVTPPEEKGQGRPQAGRRGPRILLEIGTLQDRVRRQREEQEILILKGLV